MKKTLFYRLRIPINYLQKCNVMKLFIFFLFFLNLTLSANAISQEIKITLNMSNAKLETLIKELKKQTNMRFFYSVEKLDLQGPKTVYLKNTSLKESLTSILNGTSLTYSINKNVVVIKDVDSIINDKVETTIIKGKVIDINGDLLPSVTVIVKGSFIGTTTNINGEYKLKVLDTKGLILVYSFVGMHTKEVAYSGENIINIVLVNKVENIKEIVITGYQKIEKRKLSSSIVSLRGDDILEGAALSLDNMLQGKISGLSVLNPTSTVGASPKIRIRGASSISGNREPVWVVDGIVLDDPVPISPTELNSLDNINLIGNAISSLNPDDIDRIDILKDASATAIYGVKAANGVIVVTTKRGKFGKARVNYSTNLTFMERPTYNKLHRMNSKERIEVSEEAFERGLTYRNAPAHVSYEGALYDLFAKNISYDEFLEKVKFYKEQNTDWLDELFRTSFSQTHNISLSGANTNTNYYFSGAYKKANGNFKDNSLEQYNGLLKLSSNLNEKLRVGVDMRVSSSKKKYQHSSIDPFKYAYQTSRAIPLYNKDGSLSYYNNSQGHAVPLVYNGLNELEHSGKVIENQSLNFNARVNYKILPELVFNGIVSLSRNNTYQKEWFDDKTWYAASLRYLNLGDKFPGKLDDPFYTSQCSLPYGGQLTNNDTKQTSYTIRADVNYNKIFNRVHDFSITVGTEIKSNIYEGIKTNQMGYLPDRGENFLDIDVIKFPLYQERVEALKNVITDNTFNMLSFYGTMTYAYDSRYIANFNIRADGSNKFGQDKSTKFLPIWSLSGRWNVHNEKFFKSVKWVDQLSFRASYGIQGNVSSNQTPNLIAILGTSDKTSGYNISTLDKLPNPNLKWEKTTSIDFAIEFSLFKGLVNASFDYYNKKGKDMIVSKDVSLSTGSNSMTLNAGNIENKGFDFNVIVNLISTKDISWGISLNGGCNKNTVTDAGVSEIRWKDYLTGD
ncbi:MAG: SusC/RagA family TonB-linked outer membrane protein, partial [Bacteroides sp.]|nr:SusC/RagA family TonB-linked outer membrane protein [Bacteroides sp.]